MQKEIEVTGKTVDEAIENGLEILKIEKNQAEVKILDEGKSGLFGLMGSTPARIKISVKRETSSFEENGKSTQSVSKLPPNAPDILSKILELAGFVAQVSIKDTPSESVLNVSCDDSALLIGKKGQTMRSLEYIIKLILSKQAGKGIRVAINIDGYLDRINEKTVQRAKELEEKVKMSSEPIEIKLSPSERKIIHLTLQDSPYVETVSEGDGEERKLIVRPKSR